MLGEAQSFEAQQDLSQRVAKELFEALPDSADEVRYVTTMFLQYSQSMTLLFRDGQEVGSLPGVGNVTDNVCALREAMYSPRGGTWFSAVFQVFRDGRLKSSFNYDEEPVVLSAYGTPREVMPSLYARDFDAFPRSPEATPAWLAAKVEAGRVQIAQIEAEERAKRAEG
jgi:hypothetical protein